MSFISLSPNAEKLLQKILDNQLENGNCNTDYWADRFKNLNSTEDSRLRSTFEELSEAGMISTHWADDIPYIITIFNNGLSYFDIKRDIEEKEVKEKHSNRLHDIIMLFIGAILGVLVEFLRFKLFGIGG